jgi:hypothetical protein
MRVAYSLNAQLMWLKQEAAELCQVSAGCARLPTGTYTAPGRTSWSSHVAVQSMLVVQVC